jgi:hypothetical protein
MALDTLFLQNGRKYCLNLLCYTYKENEKHNNWENQQVLAGAKNTQLTERFLYK